MNYCQNPSLGFAKVQAKCEGWESHFMLPRVWESVREWTPTLPNEFPLWELKSQWISKSLYSNFRGQNLLDWWFPSNIGKIFKRRCLKWAYMTHLDTLNTSYGQKRGWESNWQIWLLITENQVLQPHFEGMWGWHSHSRNGDLGVL